MEKACTVIFSTVGSSAVQHLSTRAQSLATQTHVKISFAKRRFSLIELNRQSQQDFIDVIVNIVKFKKYIKGSKETLFCLYFILLRTLT